MLRNAPKNVKVMAKWVGELSTGSSLVQIGVEARTINNVKERGGTSNFKQKNQKTKNKNMEE